MTGVEVGQRNSSEETIKKNIWGQWPSIIGRCRILGQLKGEMALLGALGSNVHPGFGKSGRYRQIQRHHRGSKIISNPRASFYSFLILPPKPSMVSDGGRAAASGPTQDYERRLTIPLSLLRCTADESLLACWKDPHELSNKDLFPPNSKEN